MGRTWAVVDDTGRRCEMSGFANDLVKSDIPVCSGKTVVEVDKHKVLLGLHKAPYLKLQDKLVSTVQLFVAWTTHCGSRQQWNFLQL